MPSRPCLDCGALIPAVPGTRKGTRCPDCQADKQAERPRTNAETVRRRETVAAWRDVHGDWCPGWGTDPHPARDLTADHVIPFAVSGDESSELSVLCRSCNSRKRDRTQAPDLH